MTLDTIGMLHLLLRKTGKNTDLDNDIWAIIDKLERER